MTFCVHITPCILAQTLLLTRSCRMMATLDYQMLANLFLLNLQSNARAGLSRQDSTFEIDCRMQEFWPLRI